MKSKRLPDNAARVLVAAIALSVVGALGAHAAAASDESDVRSAVEQAFNQLRAGNYGALYEVLPTASQRKVTREQFVSRLGQSRDLYELQRLEIGAVHVAGDLAAVDSVIYVRARRPFEAEGKLVTRQYLVREGGRWRVSTGDRATVNPLLAANRAFARRYPPTQPRLYVKRDGKWVDFQTMMKSAPRRAPK